MNKSLLLPEKPHLVGLPAAGPGTGGTANTVRDQPLRKWLNKLSSPVSRIQYKSDGDATRVGWHWREEAGCYSLTLNKEVKVPQGQKQMIQRRGTGGMLLGASATGLGS